MAGKNRTASWLYFVVNPWLEAIRTEVGFLEAGDPTLHSSGAELISIRPMAAYSSPGTGTSWKTS
jgi:hypothetical protein